jgi:type II secretory pathway pseudopilin PulG
MSARDSTGGITRNGPSAGFSLPEVTIALGLLAGVVISIAAMFTASEKLVNRGRHQSAAVTVARNIVEETNSWNYRSLYENFGLDGSAASYTIDTRTDPVAQRWQDELDRAIHPFDSSSKAAWAEITLESVSPTGSPPAIRDAVCIRVAVRVFWTDLTGKVRELQLATVRI